MNNYQILFLNSSIYFQSAAVIVDGPERSGLVFHLQQYLIDGYYSLCISKPIKVYKQADSKFPFLSTAFLAIALLFTLLVFRVYLYKLVDKETMGNDLLILTTSVSFVLFFFQYKSLRSQQVFLAWSVLAIIQFAMYIWLFQDPAFNFTDKRNLGIHHYANGLKVPAILLIIYRICSKWSKKYYNTQLLLPNRSLERTDYDEKRKLNAMDTTWMILSLIAILAGHFF